MRQLNKSYIKGMLCILYIILFSLFLKRIQFSVELTDEVHGIASIYNIYQGKVPFVTSWDYHTGWCILSPIFSAFCRFSPNMEGIMLFFRYVYVIFSCVCIAIVAFLLYKKTLDKDLCLLTISGIFWVSSSFFQVNYNSFTIYILLIVTVLLHTSKKEEREILRYFVMGGLMSLVCISYPTFIVGAVFLTLPIAIRNHERRERHKIIYYMLGGCVAASFFLVYILYNGSFAMLCKGLEEMLLSPHEASKGTIGIQFIKDTFLSPLKSFFLRKFTVVLMLYVLLEVVIGVWQGTGWKLINAIAFIIYSIINLHYVHQTNGYVIFGDLIGLIIFTIIADRKEVKRYWLWWIVLLLFILIYSLTSDNKNILFSFELIGPFIFVLAILIVHDICFSDYRYIGFIFALVLAVSGICHEYMYVYRDEPIKELNVKVEKGIYKGLYTTESRKNFVESLEDTVSEYVSETDRICTVTRMPAVYLMSKAQICAPQTWDAQFLTRGYTSARPLLEYFRVFDIVPDILVASDMEISDFYNNPRYEINTFISENYELYYSSEIEGNTIWLWRRNDY